MGGAYPWLPLRSLSWHLDNRSRDCLGSSSLPLTLVLLDLVQLHLFLMIQLSVVILETHTVWIRLISTKDGKMETSRIRQRQRLSRYFYGRGGGLASTSTTLRQTPLDTFLISSSSSWTLMSWSPPFPLELPEMLDETHRLSTWTLSREAHMSFTPFIRISWLRCAHLLDLTQLLLSWLSSASPPKLRPGKHTWKHS